MCLLSFSVLILGHGLSLNQWSSLILHDKLTIPPVSAFPFLG